LQTLDGFAGDAGYAIANRAADKAKASKKNEVKVTLKTGGKAKPTVTVEAGKQAEAV
jgi:hypothetical protein